MTVRREETRKWSSQCESTKDRESTDNLVAVPNSRSPVSPVGQVDRESAREERERPLVTWRIAKREGLLALVRDGNARAGGMRAGGMRADVTEARKHGAFLLMSRGHCNVRASLNNPNGTGSGDCRETGFGFPCAGVRSSTTKASHDKLADINAHGFAVLAVSFIPELSQKRHDAELLKAVWCANATVAAVTEFPMNHFFFLFTWRCHGSFCGCRSIRLILVIFDLAKPFVAINIAIRFRALMTPK